MSRKLTSIKTKAEMCNVVTPAMNSSLKIGDFLFAIWSIISFSIENLSIGIGNVWWGDMGGRGRKTTRTAFVLMHPSMRLSYSDQ
ncbi:MAG: hypothetical protein ABI618_13580, partial [Nitrospirota bacterium]